VGPLLLGMSKPVHVVSQTVTARGIVNVSAVAAMEANMLREVVNATKVAAS
jgi:malate dehydrogenase (oxaloacetate-decarboxylating)(NADP+)